MKRLLVILISIGLIGVAGFSHAGFVPSPFRNNIINVQLDLMSMLRTLDRPSLQQYIVEATIQGREKAKELYGLGGLKETVDATEFYYNVIDEPGSVEGYVPSPFIIGFTLVEDPGGKRMVTVLDIDVSALDAIGEDGSAVASQLSSILELNGWDREIE